MIVGADGQPAVMGREGTFQPEDLGLVWDGENRWLIDAETGEVVRLEVVVDEATAKAAAYRIWATEASIAVLKRQKRDLDRQIKQRTARLEYFRATYEPGIVAVAKSLMEKAKTRLKSMQIGFCKVGYSASSRSIRVTDPLIAAKHCARHAPEALQVTVDLSGVSPSSRQSLADALCEIAECWPAAAAINIRTSMADSGMGMSANGFEVDPGGKDEWYVRGVKAKEGGDGE